MSSCLGRYSVHYEFNTLDACSMAVIVVDAGRSRSTCHGHDAYIHDHCLRYRHDYSLFCQLPNSNLFTHHMLFSREKTLVKTMAVGSTFYHILKSQKQFGAIFFSLIFYFVFYLSIYLSTTTRFDPCN